ncbi:MAG: hypothetical protein LUE08_07150 [Akkermansiaceae bacterium]|nr:hypothetical protein [Akkermansiaceae bacterium]
MDSEKLKRWGTKALIFLAGIALIPCVLACSVLLGDFFHIRIGGVLLGVLIVFGLAPAVHAAYRKADASPRFASQARVACLIFLGIVLLTALFSAMA